MGQYYRPLLINKDGEMLTAVSHDFDCGIKLMEHSWIGNNFVNAVLHEIEDKPTRVVWLGDYADDYVREGCNLGGGFITKVSDFLSWFEKTWGDTKSVKILPGDTPPFNLDLESDGHYLVNVTKQCYIDLGQYIKSNSASNKFEPNDTWCINPLPLLTCLGNGLGGGDYRGEIGKDDVGSWAFDEIYITYLRPGKLEEVEYFFQE